MFGKPPKKSDAANFTLDDFRDQLEKLHKAGIQDQLPRLPGMAQMIREGEDPGVALNRVQAMLDAMTQEERLNPELIDANSQRRIAVDSGTEPGEIMTFLDQFAQIRKLMKEMSEMSMWQRIKLVMGFGRFNSGDANGPC